MVAIPDDERLITIKKKVPTGDGVSRIELLTNADWQLVHSICGKSLAGCSQAEFEAYREKFDAAENRPAWALSGEFRESDEMTKAQARWCEASIAHKQQIVQWVSDGGLSLVTADRIATTDTTTGLIRREDVKRYLDHYNLPWRDAQAKAQDADRSRSANGQPEFLEHGVTPDARELSTIGLTREQWDRMTGTQRQSALQAIADTNAYSEQAAHQADERRALGRYTLNEAAKAIAATGERFEALLEKLCGAAQRGDLPMHAPGERARYEYTNDKQVRPFYEEAYWNDLNTWFETNERRIAFRFSEPVVAMNPNIATGATVDIIESVAGNVTETPARKAADDAATAAPALGVTLHTLTKRGDLLTPVIRAVVTATGSYDSNVVFTPLREMALREEAPFNGVDKDGALLWTDASGKQKRLTKKALAERLRNLSTRGKAG